MAIDIDLSKISKEIGEPTARFVESHEEKKQKEMIYGFVIAFVVIYCAGMGMYWYLGKVNTAEAAAINSQIADLTKQNEDLLKIEQQGNAIQLRNSSALDILAKSPSWSYVFDGLERLAPKGITFNRFEVEKKDSLRMTGTSPDYETVSRFMVVMRGSDLFTNVNLASSSLAQRDGRGFVEFSITFGVSKDITRQAFEAKAQVIDQNAIEKKNETTPTAPATDQVKTIETKIDEKTGLPVL